LTGRAQVGTVHGVAVATAPIDSPIGTIEPGKIAGQRFHWEAVIDDEVVVRIGVHWLMGEANLDSSDNDACLLRITDRPRRCSQAAGDLSRAGIASGSACRP
jgi:hypothetical protein